MKQFPAVALLGARQTGKSTAARQYADDIGKKAVYFDMERNTDRQKLHDAETVLQDLQDKCVIIDEAQAIPQLFTVLRPIIDAKRKPGRFLLLGSVSPSLVKGISETLAGRIAHLELGVVNLMESQRHKIDLRKLWYKGGYPNALLAKNDEKFFLWAHHYFHSFVERDVNFLSGESLSPSTVKKLWTMLAGINGSIWNGEMLSRSLGINSNTLNKYAGFMEGAYLIHRIHPWFINIKKRIVKAPKVYFRDTGMLHYLNRIHSYTDLLGNIAAGTSWESFVIEQINQLKPAWLSLWYYRTHHGAEADLVLVKGNKPLTCIDIKLNNAPAVQRGFYEVMNDLKTTHNFIVTPGSDTYKTAKNIITCSIRTFLENHLPILK